MTPTAQNISSSSGPAEGKPKLIALDHDLNVLRDIAQALCPWFEVLRFREPLSAMALIETDPGIGAIVTEQVLPQASGVSLLETVRTRRPEVRRVLLSSYGDLASIIGGLHSGAIQAMVNKPFRREELLSAVAPQAAAARALSPQRASA